MSVLSGTLLANKDAAPHGYAPLLIAQFVFADGTSAYFSTRNLSSGEGGTAYGGHDYLARIAEQDLQQIQARSEQGIDRIADVTLHLLNADQFIWANYEKASGKGFKGARLYLALILMDIDPSTGGYVFTSDSPAPLKFSGICDAPSFENGGQTLTVRATTSHNLARVDFPILHVQQRCINIFPQNAAQRALGSTDMSSWWFDCGYNPGVSGGTGSFTTCGYTKADCVARGLYSQGRFKAIQWGPTNRVQQSKSYTQGRTVTVFSSRNDSIYERSYPMMYGTQWIKRPIVANIIGDGNSTRFEVVICAGEISPTDGIWQVVVNGVIVPPKRAAGWDPLFRWNFLDQETVASTHTGSRDGFANTDNGYNGLGDPYGGLATIEVVVYSDLAQSNSAPDIRILLNGPKVKVPNTNDPADQASWPYLPNNIPSWVVMDLLVWGNYSYSELDIRTFSDMAAVAVQQVSYVDPFGNTKNHNRFICELALEDRRKGNEVIQAVLRSFNAQLVPNSETGLLQLFIRQSLADQQPNPVDGSNYTTAVASIRATTDGGGADGRSANGYVAYLIDESIIQSVQQADGSMIPKINGPYCVPNAQAANRVSFPFQDSDNAYADDSISVVDADDVARAAGYQLGGQTIDAGFTVLGISNFDQGSRVANVIIAENLRGNENGDTRGTRFWDVETTHRLEHLRVGHIVLFRYQAMGLQPAVQLQSPSGTGITGILCRVEAIKATADYKRMTITLRWHEDAWYMDGYRPQNSPEHSDPGKFLPARPPYPWKPYGAQPISGDSMWDESEWNFAMSQVYEAAADGTPIAKLVIGGCPPVNQLSSDIQPPLMGIQGTTANTGGTIHGGQRIVFALSVQDSSGKWSPLSVLGQVDIPTGTNTNTAITPVISWPASVAAWRLFAGNSEPGLCWQSSGTSTSSTLTITSLSVATYGPPDALGDSLAFFVTRVFHGGDWGDACTDVATDTLTFGVAVDDHQYADYDLTLLANPIGSTDNVPIMDFHVTDNIGGVYTVTPDPLAAGVLPGAVFEMRSKANIVSDTTVGDSNYDSAYAPGGLAADAEIGHRVRIIKGTGRGQERTIIGNTGTTLTVDSPWDVNPDSTSRFIVIDSTEQASPNAYQSAADFDPSPAPVVATVDVNNYRQQVVLVEAVVEDPKGNLALDAFCPRREIYVWGAQGTRTVFADDTQLLTDGTVLFDTSGITGSTDMLSADIADTTGTSISLTSGAMTANGTVIEIGTERMFIEDGEGTGSLTVQRGYDGTTAATHTSGDTVNLPGALTYQLLRIDQVPNLKLVLAKISTDINYVEYKVASGSGDTLPGGGTSGILPDDSADRGTVIIQAAVS